MKKNKLGILVMMLCLLALVGCKEKNSPTTEAPKATEASTSETITEAEGGDEINLTKDPSQLEDVVLEDLAKEYVSHMTLEEKVGQMFLVNIEQLESAAGKTYQYKNMTDTMKKNMQRYPVGGVILFARNIKTRSQAIEFIKNMQGLSATPMYIGVDEEGGTISRIASNPKMKTTQFPNMSVIGVENDEERAFEVGDTIGKEIKALGFNLDFAPVADINTNPNSHEIGDRSFGSDKDLVAKMVTQVVKGLQGQNVSATLKHFPGHGDAATDTHKGYASITHNIKRLRKVEFVPFQAGIEAGADFVMVSHVVLTELVTDETPSSLSKLIVTDILRNELGYENIIITDAMNMKAITNFYKPEEAAKKAVLAGVDMILMPEDLPQAYYAVLEAVEKDEISEKRIDKSVVRIIKLKMKRGIIPIEKSRD